MTQELLDMIEKVDPADSDALDEIDARFWCWLNKLKYQGHRIYDDDDEIEDIDKEIIITSGQQMGYFLRKNAYTRSLDAIKAVEEKELEGYYPCVRKVKHEFPERVGIECMADTYAVDLRGFDSFHMPTEPLARLHMLIRVMNFKRKNAADT